MRRTLLCSVLVVASVALASACGGGTGSTTAGTPELNGAALYSANCASCHGADLGGTERGPSHLSIVYEPSHHPDSAFRAAIESGAGQHHWNFGPMPSIDNLTDDEVDVIIAFVRGEQERQGFEQ